jgi:hypothetical protein
VQEFVLSSPAHFGYCNLIRRANGSPSVHRVKNAAPQAGAVYLYENTGAAAPFVFPSEHRLTTRARTKRCFGSAVALKHGVLLVGSPGATVDGQRRKGKVHRYLLNGAQWSADGELTAPCRQPVRVRHRSGDRREHPCRRQPLCAKRNA